MVFNDFTEILEHAQLKAPSIIKISVDFPWIEDFAC